MQCTSMDINGPFEEEYARNLSIVNVGIFAQLSDPDNFIFFIVKENIVCELILTVHLAWEHHLIQIQ